MTVFDILTDTRENDKELFYRLTRGEKLKRLREMPEYHVSSTDYMNFLNMDRYEVVDILSAIKEMYTKIKAGTWSDTMDKFMYENDLSTVADVREYLKFDLKKTFITKATFNSLNTTDLQFIKDEREIIELCETDKMFNRFIDVTHTRVSGEWVKTYFRYCCLEFEGRKIMSQLSQPLLTTLEMDNIHLDRELAKWFCNGHELEDLTGANAKDKVLITGEFLRPMKGDTVEYTIDNALQVLTTIADHHCQLWSIVTRKLTARNAEILYLVKDLSYTAIGSMYNLTSSRVRDIVENAKRKCNRVKIVATVENTSLWSTTNVAHSDAKKILASFSRPWAIFKRALEDSEVPQTFMYLGFVRNRVELFKDMQDYTQSDVAYKDQLYLTDDELNKIYKAITQRGGAYKC